jgi:hypothetical protein
VVHAAGEEYQAAYLASLPTQPALENRPLVGLDFDQRNLDEQRAEVERRGAKIRESRRFSGDPEPYAPQVAPLPQLDGPGQRREAAG